MLITLRSDLFLLLFFTLLASCNTTPPSYNRSDWGSWKTKDCINTREHLLKSRSVKNSIMGPDGCKVKNGAWIDFYTGEKINLNNNPQIDHVIPLKHAHTLGAYKWRKNQRKAFYNDPDNLVITSRSMNLEKQDKSFVSWHPLSHDLTCKYAYRWVLVKLKYGLRFSKKECFNFNTLEKAKLCPSPLPKIKLCSKYIRS